MALGRHEREIRFEPSDPGWVVWIAPVGTPFPEEGEYIDEPWELIQPRFEVPDAPPVEDVDSGP